MIHSVSYRLAPLAKTVCPKLALVAVAWYIAYIRWLATFLYCPKSPKVNNFKLPPQQFQLTHWVFQTSYVKLPCGVL